MRARQLEHGDEDSKELGSLYEELYLREVLHINKRWLAMWRGRPGLDVFVAVAADCKRDNKQNNQYIDWLLKDDSSLN